MDASLSRTFNELLLVEPMIDYLRTFTFTRDDGHLSMETLLAVRMAREAKLWRDVFTDCPTCHGSEGVRFFCPTCKGKGALPTSFYDVDGVEWTLDEGTATYHRDGDDNMDMTVVHASGISEVYRRATSD